MNHTSVDHPWFQAAGDRESPFHDFYVWSDERPRDAHEGVIFPGSQESTWSYDQRVDRWYMHRFYSHQPDLNINSAKVRDEIHKVIGYWLELGLSGFRVDAVPFLIEQQGAANPAVSDPHGYLRDLRAFLSRRRGDAILLAEANEPLERLPDYFGGAHGDEMHMLFDFIGNQALYLSLVRGDARPLAKALRDRPPEPAVGQWANFVRNHDELSLDKLTDRERDEVFSAYAPDPRMRIYGRGIRRRFPSMVEGDRARIELAYSLCFSLPGAPVLFYGEELGMGDDQSLEGRHAVRIAMPWTGERNGGFSDAPRPAIARPPLDSGPFGHRRINADLQRQRRGSLLHWFQELIRVRRAWPEIGWGEWRLLRTGDDAVLAHASHWHGGDVMAVHNLAGRPVTATLRPDGQDGDLPWRHLFGVGGPRPPVPQDGETLGLELPPYGYHWFGRRRRA